MFGVGMHFSIGDLLAVRKIAVPGAIGQIAASTLLAAGVAMLWGWPLVAGLVFGLALSVASTVVLLRALETRGILNSPDGQIAIGWLIVEDLVMILALVILPALAGSASGEVAESGATTGIGLAVALAIGKVVAFIVVILVLGTRLFPLILRRIETTGSRELFTLCVIALSLGIAFVSAEVFGVSFALGAFFAGVVIHESDLSHRAAEELRPLQDTFSALFFVSVGMMLDPAVLFRQPL